MRTVLTGGHANYGHPKNDDLGISGACNRVIELDPNASSEEILREQYAVGAGKIAAKKMRSAYPKGLGALRQLFQDIGKGLLVEHVILGSPRP